MPPQIPDEVPRTIVAGTTVKWHRSFNNFRASDGWTYLFYAVGATSKFQIAGATNPDENSFDIVIPPTLTAPLTAPVWPARFQCAERLTSSDDPPQIVDPRKDSLQLMIEANIATAAPGFYLSHPERALALIEPEIEARIALDTSSYSVAQRNVVKEQLDQLRKARGMYLAAIYRLQHPGKLGPGVSVAFTTDGDDDRYPPTWVDITGIDA